MSDHIEPEIRCSFCKKTAGMVRKIIAGPDSYVAICNECIDLCDDIIAEECDAEAPEETTPKEPGDPRFFCSFCGEAFEWSSYRYDGPSMKASICEPCVQRHFYSSELRGGPYKRQRWSGCVQEDFKRERKMVIFLRDFYVLAWPFVLFIIFFLLYQKG